MNRDTAATVGIDALVTAGMKAVVITAVDNNGDMHEWRRGLDDNEPVEIRALIPTRDEGGQDPDEQSAEDGE